ncbi:hypothetical protein [Wenxinia marina]|uniref:Uncharacterized protein n=1 Tax=Wenxinia marina DSM 24838 TaxID=1123501 RepID=A0A0D0Q713_9RHOB|nr:hypothetical protein [Wenxinia marina]KIQ68212.1 hypothetical protein Wenmar_03222 [Wenxinia marina DSM 24838]GGL76794.1 hypothetical protein GCM10011392_34060 [Wenxinia marina]
MSKIFTYEQQGLSYTVTVYEDPDNPGHFLADIAVLEGAMDVNAIYYGDDDFSGTSAGLKGPLNMNGAKLDGENVQWDDAVKLSDPGLGPEGADKETYLSSGEHLTVDLNIDSLDDIDVFGIRATSTTTPEGSIKDVSDEPEEPEEPDEPTFDKVGFGVDIGENGGIDNGVFLRAEDLPDGQDATFENYVSLYESEFGDDEDYSIPNLESVIFYEIDEGGSPHELFRIDAPEGGFADGDALIEAYDDAISAGALDGLEDDSSSLMASLELDEDAEFDLGDLDEDHSEDAEMVF